MKNPVPNLGAIVMVHNQGFKGLEDPLSDWQWQLQGRPYQTLPSRSLLTAAFLFLFFFFAARLYFLCSELTGIGAYRVNEDLISHEGTWRRDI